MDFYALAQQCSQHNVENVVMAAIVDVESSYNPYAIGVVGGAIRQPRSLSEAVAAVRRLQTHGYNYSVGLAQVNKINFRTYGLNESNMFDPCTNIRAGSHIYKMCYDRANRVYGNGYSHDGKLRLAASCYYSGNFRTGFIADFKGQLPYVDKFYNALVKYRGVTHSKKTHENAHTSPSRGFSKSSARVVPPTHIKSNHSENTAISDDVGTLPQTDEVSYTQITSAVIAQQEQYQSNQSISQETAPQKTWAGWDVFRDF